MAAMISLDAIEKGLQSFVESLKAASLCRKTGASIIKLKESVQQLSREAETLHLAGSDLLEYKRLLQPCTGILTELEEPSADLNTMSETLTTMLHQVVSEQRLTSELLSSLKRQLNEMSDTARVIGEGVHEFKNAVARVREFCINVLDGTKTTAKELKDRASSMRQTGIIGGSTVAGIGAGALTLGILGICTGGVGFIAAGVAGVTVGCGVMVGGGVVAVDAVLSAQELDRKATKFLDAVKRMELAKKGLDGLEQDMKKGVVKLTEDMIKGLETGLAVFGRMEAAVQRSEQLQTEVDSLKDENADLRRELEELRMRQSD